MFWYLIRRLILVIPTLVGVAIAVFFLIRVMPGDVVVVKLRADGAAVSEETIEAERKRLGLDKPLYRDSWIDHGVRVVAVSGLAIPSFWLGMLIILGLLSLFNWLPKIGYVSLWDDPLTNLSVTIWPAASVGYRYAAVATRMMRSSLLEVMREDYIRTARAKGVWTRLIMRRHALRNAMLPVVTVVGLEFAFLIGGLVVTEQVFNINGVGKLFVDATARGDFNLIQGLVLLIATVFVLVNLLVDLVYGWLDPRIRLR